MQKKRQHIVKVFVILCIISAALSGCGKQESDFINQLEKNEIDSLSAEGEEKINENFNVAEEHGEDAFDSVYELGGSQVDSMVEMVEQPQEKKSGGMKEWIKKIYLGIYKFFASVKMFAIPIILISEVVGFIGASLSRKNKAAKKFFIVTACIGIPLLTIGIIFGYGYLTDIFYYKR